MCEAFRARAAALCSAAAAAEDLKAAERGARADLEAAAPAAVDDDDDDDDVAEDVAELGRRLRIGAEEDVAATLPDRALPALRGIQVVQRGVVASHEIFGTGGRRRFPRILHPPSLARARRV